MLMYEITLATYKVHMLHIGGLKLQKDIHPLERRDNPVLEYVNTLETENNLSMCWRLHSYSVPITLDDLQNTMSTVFMGLFLQQEDIRVETVTVKSGDYPD